MGTLSDQVAWTEGLRPGCSAPELMLGAELVALTGAVSLLKNPGAIRVRCRTTFWAPQLERKFSPAQEFLLASQRGHCLTLWVSGEFSCELLQSRWHSTSS